MLLLLLFAIQALQQLNQKQRRLIPGECEILTHVARQEINVGQRSVLHIRVICLPCGKRG